MASKVHRVRYYNPKPQSINCGSFNKINKVLALARADASIEIWDLSYAPYMVKFIPGVENGSVEALGWVNDRLLSTGLGGALIEWDLNKLCLKTSVLLTGYAAWCLDVNSQNTLVAVGTEQGYLNLFSVEYDEIVYKKLFDKQEGRIMCCKFDNTGNVLVTGSIDTIRVWNVETGHATTRISVTRRGKETIVWCLAVLSDNIIVSGDSHGRITFWDRTVGDQIESYVTHRADILSIAVSEDERSFYCSGVDPVIMNFVKVDKNTDNNHGVQWVKNIQRHIHEHDVRALILLPYGNKLVSLGADGYLSLSSHPPKWVMRVPQMLPTPRSSLCTRKKLLLLRYSNHLEIWKLGSYSTSDVGDVVVNNFNTKKNKKKQQQLEENSALVMDLNKMSKDKKNESLKITENPIKLVSIKTKGNKQIRCCELSPTGEFIIYSTDSDVRMLKLETEEDQTNTMLSKILISGLSSPCDRVAFTEDSRSMVVHCAGVLQVLQVDPEAGATVIQSISTEKHLKSSSVLHLQISKISPSNSIYLVVADSVGAIAVWILKTKKFEHYVTLPKYKCVPSAIMVDSERENLVVAYVDQKVVEYSLTDKKFTDWPGDSLPNAWLSRNSAAVSVTSHPRRNALVFQDETSLWILEKEFKNDREEPVAKKKPNSKKSIIPFRIVPIKYLAGFHWMESDEAVTLEILPENIVSQLPPVLATNTRK